MMFNSIAITLGLALVTITTQAYGNGIPSAELLITNDSGTVLFDQVINKDAASASELAVVWNPDINVDPDRSSFDYAEGNGAAFYFLLEPTSSIPGPGDTVLSTPYGYATDILVYMPSYLTSEGLLPAIGLFSEPHPVFSDYWTQYILDESSPSHFIAKTGDFQDLSALLFSDPGIHLAVRSDIQLVPIPAAAWFFGSALGVMGWMRRKVAA